jgi:hypothetical protein
MPANVTVEFEKARMAYEQASSPEARLAALLEMQRFAPKHKGAEKLRRDISRKIAAARKEAGRKKELEKKSKRTSIGIPKEGIGQVVLVGMPNSGKSTLLKALTGVEVEIAPYGFTTTKPVVGMLDFHGAKIQLVELPAIVRGSSSGKFNGTQLLAVARNSDAIVLVVKSNEEEKILADELEKAGILLNKEKPKIKISSGSFKGISIAGKQFLKCRESELVQYLKDVGIAHASIVLSEPATLEAVSRALNESLAYKRAITVNPSEGFGEKGIEELKQKIFGLLRKVLIFTKKPGKDADYDEPLALPEGTTVGEAAKCLHKDFAKMRFARLWGSSKYKGQRVPKNYRLKNFDVLEICC